MTKKRSMAEGIVYLLLLAGYITLLLYQYKLVGEKTSFWVILAMFPLWILVLLDRFVKKIF